MLKTGDFCNRNKLNLNSQEFYKRRPDLAPRNIYLATGRVTDMKKTKRTIENFGETFWVRAKNWLRYKIETLKEKL